MMNQEFSEFDNPSFRNIDGYVFIYVPKLGYRKRARLVMAAHLGRQLLSTECVHHVNKITHDDRLENLKIVSSSEHSKIHAKQGRCRNGEMTQKTKKVLRYLGLRPNSLLRRRTGRYAI